MKQQVKIFKFYSSNLTKMQNDINEWLDRNNLVIDDITFTKGVESTGNRIIAQEAELYVLVVYHNEEVTQDEEDSSS